MAQRLGGVGVACAPVGEEPQRARQLGAGGAQLVRHPRWPLGVRAAHHDRLPLEVTQALGEDVRRDAADVPDQLVEAAGAAEERVDHEQRPPVADALERPGERRVVHDRILARHSP